MRYGLDRGARGEEPNRGLFRRGVVQGTLRRRETTLAPSAKKVPSVSHPTPVEELCLGVEGEP